MSDSPKRRWYAFRLRTLLVVVVVLGCLLTPLAIKVNKARDQKKVVEWVLENGGDVRYDWQSDDLWQTDEVRSPPGPEWLRAFVGDECFQAVKNVRLIKTQVSDISPLRRLTSLRKLVLTGSPVTDLSPLRQLTNLQELSIGLTQVSDLAPLQGLTNLRVLSLHRTQVSDLSPLKELINLQELRINNTRVSDLTPLARLTSLHTLWLSGTPVQQLADTQHWRNGGHRSVATSATTQPRIAFFLRRPQ